MSLPPGRARAYTCGALTGAFAAVAAVAVRDGRRRAAVAAALASVVCGGLAVAFEERTQAVASETDAD
jgi:hypothetical protein